MLFNFEDNTKREKGGTFPFNFEDNIKQATLLLQDVASELQTKDMNKAGRIFRAVLQALRDRMPVHDAIKFSSQLPIYWKGVYFDHYNLSNVPADIRTESEWVHHIRSKNAFAANNDFQQDDEISESFRAVFRALEGHITDGQLQKVRESFLDIETLLVA